MLYLLKKIIRCYIPFVDMLYGGGTDLTDIYIFHSCQLAKQAILPRVHGLALKTTVAAVCILTYLFILYFFSLFTYIIRV